MCFRRIVPVDCGLTFLYYFWGNFRNAGHTPIWPKIFCMLMVSRLLQINALALALMLTMDAAQAQNGAGYDPAATQFRAPELSLAGGKASAELDAAMGLLWNGETDAAVGDLEKLATHGDVKAALFLGSVYRKKSKLPIEPDPSKALHFYQLASKQGSGEASERIAEMLEHREIRTSDGQDTAHWRALAVEQGWIQQQLAVFCFQWIHGPEQLHCVSFGQMSNKDSLGNGCPSGAEMDRLRLQGITGTLRQTGASELRSDGPSAKVILIKDRPVAGEQDLKQPFAASVIYLQTAG